MLLAKSILNCIKVLISKALIDSNISPNDFLWYQICMISNKKSKILMINKLYINQCCLIVWSVEKMQNVNIQKYLEVKTEE